MTAREPFSLVVTTLDNAATLERCLRSVPGADEIVLLDSGSSDDTVAIAERCGARVAVQPFAGYGPQKQAAIGLARNRWVLLLDADEALTPESHAAVLAALAAPTVAGYTLPRREQLFWTFAHRAARHNPMLRLFDRERVHFTADAIHAAPDTREPVDALASPFLHYGEPDIATKVAKINHYSSGTVAGKQAAGTRFVLARMLFQPPWHFFRSYVLKRKFLGGWAALIGCVVDAFYVFLKYAKLYEAARKGRAED